MLFEDVIGHGAVLATLRRAAAAGVLPHAILLAGPQGVGKTSLAEALAQQVLDAAAWPGGLAAHPDHWLEDGDGERIGIDRVRGGGARDALGLRPFLSLRPYAGGARVAVIARAERLTEQAANSLLKSIEEPPPGTHIVVCASYPDRLPQTILSRCQLFSCVPVPPGEVRTWLETRHHVAAETARLAAALSAGRPGRALRLATEPGALSEEASAVDGFLAAAGTGVAGALRAAAKLSPGQGADAREVGQRQLAAWTGFLRDVACVTAGAPELVVWQDLRPAAERWAAALPLERTLGILDRLQVAAEQLSIYVQPRLLYEVLFLDIFTRTPAPPLLTLAERGVVPVPAGLAAATPARATARGRTPGAGARTRSGAAPASSGAGARSGASSAGGSNRGPAPRQAR